MEFKVGDKVKYMGDCHGFAPMFYPERGTVGTVCELAENDVRVRVQWPVGSTSEDDAWWVAIHNLIKEE